MNNPYERCSSCNAGSGLTLSTYTGEPTDCYECHGTGVVRRRDARGRFSTVPEPGYAEYACRTAVRDLIAAIGEESARDRIRSYLEDESGRVKRERMVA
jgi:hypothetical protein